MLQTYKIDCTFIFNKHFILAETKSFSSNTFTIISSSKNVSLICNKTIRQLHKI